MNTQSNNSSSKSTHQWLSRQELIALYETLTPEYKRFVNNYIDFLLAKTYAQKQTEKLITKLKEN